MGHDGVTHYNCFHPKWDERIKADFASPWDLLKEFWQTCGDHEFEEEKIEA